MDSTTTRSPVLSGQLLSALSDAGVVKTFPKHAIVVVEGEPAERLYIIEQGQLRVYVSDEDGREVELNLLGPGEHFGELMLASAKRTASVRTLEASRLRMIGREDFEALIVDHPALAFHLIQTLIHRVKVLTENVQSLALMDVYGRVARLLLESASPGTDDTLVVTQISQAAIGKKVGASRSMVNRIFKDLTAGGYIAVDRNGIRLLKTLPKRW
ncbi:MAG: Crp/Fnr family transcriptional regulator [Burkholderiaceae bacterium]